MRTASFASSLLAPPSQPLSGRARAYHAPSLPASLRKSLRRNQQRGNLQVVSVSLDDLDLEMPDIDEDLRTYQIKLGAIFGDDGSAEVPSYFERKVDKAEAALNKGCAVIDLSNWGRISIGGEGALPFLQGQSTQDFRGLQPGQGTETVFTDAQGRTIDLGRCFVLGSSVMVVVAPETRKAVVERLEKHVFPADRVRLVDVTSRTAMLAVAGPEADELLRELQAEAVIDKPVGTHMVLNYGGKAAIIAKGCGLPINGYTLIIDESAAGELYRSLITKGAKPIGTRDWERVRVRAGRPYPGKELTKDYNPLEAGLYDAVSVNKGCYVGQETIAKVHNLGAVKQQLWGLAVAAAVKEGSEVRSLATDEVLGKVTSAIKVEVDGFKRCYALGYVRCRSKGAQLDLRGVEVKIEDSVGVVIDVPYLSRTFREGAAPPAAEAAGEGAGAQLEERKAAAQKEAQDKAAAEAEAKAERVKAMQDRLNAYMAQRQGQQEQAGQGQASPSGGSGTDGSSS